MGNALDRSDHGTARRGARLASISLDEEERVTLHTALPDEGNESAYPQQRGTCTYRPPRRVRRVLRLLLLLLLLLPLLLLLLSAVVYLWMRRFAFFGFFTPAQYDIPFSGCPNGQSSCIAEVFMSNISISTRSDGFFSMFNPNIGWPDATFVCEVSRFSFTADQWLTSFQPLIMEHAPGGDSFMHHLNVYLCSEDVLEWAQEAARDETMCADYTFMTVCPKFAWVYDHYGIDQGGFDLPTGLGYAVGPTAGLTRVMLVAHYLAPLNMLPHWTIHDRSGLRMTVTASPRVSVSTFGTGRTGFILPAGVERHHEWAEVDAAGLAEILGHDMDRNGGHVDVTAFHLHGHNTLISTWVEHFRGVDERVGDLAALRSYRGYSLDEAWRTLSQPVKLRRGDWLRLHCIFNTSQHAYLTGYGVGNGDEMCMAIFMYSPGDPTWTRRWAFPTKEPEVEEGEERAYRNQFPDHVLPVSNLARDHRGETLTWSGLNEDFLRSSQAWSIGWRKEDDRV